MQPPYPLPPQRHLSLARLFKAGLSSRGRSANGKKWLYYFFKDHKRQWHNVGLISTVAAATKKRLPGNAKDLDNDKPQDQAFRTLI
jgi:hypothetical protein